MLVFVKEKHFLSGTRRRSAAYLCLPVYSKRYVYFTGFVHVCNICLFEYIKRGFFCVSQISVNMHSKCLWPLKPMPYKSDLFSFKADAAWVTAFSFKRFCVKNLSLSLGRLMGSCVDSDASKPIV